MAALLKASPWRAVGCHAVSEVKTKGASDSRSGAIERNIERNRKCVCHVQTSAQSRAGNRASTRRAADT